MEVVTHTKYKCSICGKEYNTQEEAISCEQIPITHDKGIRVGDKVLVTYGEGSGHIVPVVSMWIIPGNWDGPQQYLHTPCIQVEFPHPIYGNRNLLYDDYEKA